MRRQDRAYERDYYRQPAEGRRPFSRNDFADRAHEQNNGRWGEPLMQRPPLPPQDRYLRDNQYAISAATHNSYERASYQRPIEIDRRTNGYRSVPPPRENLDDLRRRSRDIDHYASASKRARLDDYSSRSQSRNEYARQYDHTSASPVKSSYERRPNQRRKERSRTRSKSRSRSRGSSISRKPRSPSPEDLEQDDRYFRSGRRKDKEREKDANFSRGRRRSLSRSLSPASAQQKMQDDEEEDDRFFARRLSDTRLNSAKSQSQKTRQQNSRDRSRTRSRSRSRTVSPSPGRRRRSRDRMDIDADTANATAKQHTEPSILGPGFRRAFAKEGGSKSQPALSSNGVSAPLLENGVNGHGTAELPIKKVESAAPTVQPPELPPIPQAAQSNGIVKDAAVIEETPPVDQYSTGRVQAVAPPVVREVYERLTQVGEGTYGKVYKARNTENNSLVALKRIRMEAEKDGFPVTSVREIKLLQNLRHPNVINLAEIMVSHGSVYMVFDYMDHDLTGVLRCPEVTFEPAHLKSLMSQLLKGLAYIHNRGILHRDLKGSNVLLSKHGVLKIADFGLARFYARNKRNDYTNRVITQWYKPPELLYGATVYGPEVDIWSAGCILLELHTKRPVFNGQDEIHQLDVIFKITGTPNVESWPNVVNLPWYELVKPRQPLPDRFRDTFAEKWLTSEGSVQLAEALLALNPEQRLSAEDALTLPYFTSEEPKAEQPTMLASIIGDWHELEAKALVSKKKAQTRKEQKDKEKGNKAV